MRRPAILDLAPECRATLDAIAKKQRQGPDCYLSHLPGCANTSAAQDRAHWLQDRGRCEILEPLDRQRATYRMTNLGWSVVGDPPLWLCHPATKENAHG